MKLEIGPSLLLPGTVRDGGSLVLPEQGGGLRVDDVAVTPQRYLNLTVTVYEDHSQAFEFRAYAAGEETPRVTVRFGVMPRFRTFVSLDMNWLDGHVLFPGNEAGELKVVCHGSRIERTDIARAQIVSMPSFHPLRVSLEDVELSDASRGPSPLPAGKLVDCMGQYIPKDWPGKMPDPDTMVRRIREQASLPGGYPFSNWTGWGGCADMPLAQGTGFFTHVKDGGRWYLADPDGCAFYSMGPDCAAARADGRVDGLEELLEWVPSGPDLAEDSARPFGETGRGRGRMVSFERANLKRAFGEKWYEAWQGMVTGQLRRMGMNTLGNWSDPALYGKMPYVTSLPRFPETKERIFRDFPDVLSPEYGADARRCAAALAERRDDPYMIGYFLRNEPGWAFVDGLVLADEVLRTGRDSFCRRGLIAFLKEKYGAVRALDGAWGAAFSSWDDLLSPVPSASRISPAANRDLRAFSERLVREYVGIPARECRRADPHHMVLGMRWAWISDPALAAGWENFDVFSINCYAQDPTRAIDRVRELGVDLPVMIGEFHFGALDAGLTATGLEGVPDQAEKGRAYRYYLEHAAAHPMSVGCHWFQCYDQFALGRFDGENYNIGLFDVCLQPYPEMARASIEAAGRVYGIHAGRIPPTDRAPGSIPMIAY